MAKFSKAKWKVISGSSGNFLGGPAKIVHHTTEGSTAQGAFDAFKKHRSDPHFTVDATTIYQHIDTAEAARALKNPAGGVETNRDGAIQIEIVGFAHRAKTRATLENVRKLCRWIEKTHSVPKVWPNGHPKPAVNGRDPGGHNRNAKTWDTKGGHYGHSNVPENDHWDPGYTEAEVKFVMMEDAEAEAAARNEGPDLFESIPFDDPGLEGDHSRMPDHSEPNGPITEAKQPDTKAPRKPKARATKSARPASRTKSAKSKANVARDAE